jgi:Flp pilus assembly protein TadG
MTRARQVITREDGSDLVEFALVMIPLFLFVFAIMCVSWFIFAKASLQHAVREGCRYAVTGQAISDIQDRVLQNAVGVPGMTAKKVQVQYFAQSDTTKPLPDGPTANAGGNLVTVSVSGITVSPLGPAGLGFSALTISAAASDVMESHQ